MQQRRPCFGGASKQLRLEPSIQVMAWSALDNHTRGGMKVFKRKDFHRWQASERLPDIALCEAVREIECGLVDAKLGGGLYKVGAG